MQPAGIIVTAEESEKIGAKFEMQHGLLLPKMSYLICFNQVGNGWLLCNRTKVLKNYFSYVLDINGV